MTDRELLELAAKAAGVSAHWITYCTIQARPLFVVSVSGSMGAMPYEEEWNPLKNDGDALRLAVRLYMRVTVNSDATDVYGGEHGIHVRELYYGCRDAATRRAIVRAAAEIGRRQAAKATGHADSGDGPQKDNQ